MSQSARPFVIVSEPMEYPEYSPQPYYALFFKDLEGIKYEIVYHGSLESSDKS